MTKGQTRSSARPPLQPLPNGTSRLSPAARALKPDFLSRRRSSSITATAHTHSVNASEQAIMDTNRTDPGERPPKSSNKRVSFGGENINFIYPNNHEVASSEDDQPPSKSSKLVPRSSPRQSAAPASSSTYHNNSLPKRRSNAYEDVESDDDDDDDDDHDHDYDDDDHEDDNSHHYDKVDSGNDRVHDDDIDNDNDGAAGTAADTTTDISSGPPTRAVPTAPEAEPDDSEHPILTSLDKLSPLLPAGDFVDATELRRSFGIFRDEEAMPEKHVSDQTADNHSSKDADTIEIGGWSRYGKRRDSIMSVADDGDVTQEIAGVNDLLDIDESADKRAVLDTRPEEGALEHQPVESSRNERAVIASGRGGDSARSSRMSEDGLPLVSRHRLSDNSHQVQEEHRDDNNDDNGDDDDGDGDMADTCITLPAVTRPSPANAQRVADALVDSGNRRTSGASFAFDMDEMIKRDEDDSVQLDPHRSAPRRLTDEFGTGAPEEELTLHWHKEHDRDGNAQAGEAETAGDDADVTGKSQASGGSLPSAGENAVGDTPSPNNGENNVRSPTDIDSASVPNPHAAQHVATATVVDAPPPPDHTAATMPSPERSGETPVKETTPGKTAPVPNTPTPESTGRAAASQTGEPPVSSTPEQKSGDGNKPSLHAATPRSPAASLIIAMSEERASAHALHRAGIKTTGSNSGGMPAENASIVETGMPSSLPAAYSILDSVQKQKANSPVSLTFENFKKGLYALGVPFEEPPMDRSSTMRESALMQLEPEPEFRKFDPMSTEGKMIDAARKQAVSVVVNEEIRRLRERIAREREDWRRLEGSLEAEKPAVFKSICNYSMQDKGEATKYRLNLKRLRKVGTMKARRKWAESRLRWETSIVENLKRVEDALKADMKDLANATEMLERMMETYGIPSRDDGVDEEAEDEALVVARRTVVHEMSRSRDLRNYLKSQQEEEKELIQKVEEMREKDRALAERERRLEKYAEADTAAKLRKLLLEQRELNMIVSGITGLVFLQVSKNAMVVRVGGCMDVSFSMHEERVINVSCKTVQFSPVRSSSDSGDSDSDRGDGAGTSKDDGRYQRFIENVNNVGITTSGIRNVKYMRRIPMVLRQLSELLMRSKRSLDEMELYLKRNDGEVVGCGVYGSDGRGIEVSAKCAFFCMKRQSRFEVRGRIVTRVRSVEEEEEKGSELGAVVQSVEILGIDRDFGEFPSDEEIRRRFAEGSSKASGDLMSLGDGFTALWTLVDDGGTPAYAAEKRLV